jgi:hypothetical protein
MPVKISRRNGLTFLAVVLVVFVIILISFSAFFSLGATSSLDNSLSQTIRNSPVNDLTQLSLPPVIVSHQATPKPLRAVYMSSWVAGNQEARDKLLERLKGTSVNAIVIDVKDSSGKIVVKLDAPALAKYESLASQVPDIIEFVNELHQKNFYVIGHISVFEDNYLTRRRPDLAIQRLDNNQLWEDDKGMSWLDPSSQEVWDYAIAVAKEAYVAGFDELNFDYVRFPSDGKISNMRFPYYDPNQKTKSEVIEGFFSYLHNQVQNIGVPISADIFGMATTNTDDLGIGQILEKISPYVDYICPMVYPSSYPLNFRGIKRPALAPYQIIKLSLDSAVKRLTIQGLPVEKLRPWLQDFNLGAVYTASMIKSEIKAVNDSGLDSWMMWDSSNKYTINAYRKTDAN